jgi:RimJ/RimL family protein N-acetyltransferase
MRLVHGSIYLKHPTLEELKYTEILLSCKDTMSFNNKWGGTVPFPKEKWQAFYDTYLTDKTRNVYFHIYNLDHVFVGEVSARYLEDQENYMLNIKIKHEYRGNHHASDALIAFLDYMFLEQEMKVIYDDVASDNMGGIKLLESVGFQIVKSDPEVTLLKIERNDYL